MNDMFVLLVLLSMQFTKINSYMHYAVRQETTCFIPSLTTKKSVLARYYLIYVHPGGLCYSKKTDFNSLLKCL